MISKTIQQLAIGYGAAPASVVCQINGNTIFSGTIQTLDEPEPELPNSSLTVDNVAWTWTEDADYTGNKTISIAVSNSPLLLGVLKINNPYNTAAGFQGFTATIDGVETTDPFANETINGTPVAPTPGGDLTGQWWWWIPAGATFVATLHVAAAEQPEDDGIVFGNVPLTMPPGSTGVFEVSLTNEDRPYPRTFTWQIINGSSTDSDFVAANGTVVFNSANSSFNISTVAHDPAQGPKDFKVCMVNSSNMQAAVSSMVNIS